jgi:hypothetical protein
MEGYTDPNARKSAENIKVCVNVVQRIQFTCLQKEQWSTH